MLNVAEHVSDKRRTACECSNFACQFFMSILLATCRRRHVTVHGNSMDHSLKSFDCFAAEYGRYKIPSNHNPLPPRVAGEKCLPANSARYTPVQNPKLHPVSAWELGMVRLPARQ